MHPASQEFHTECSHFLSTKPPIAKLLPLFEGKGNPQTGWGRGRDDHVDLV